MGCCKEFRHSRQTGRDSKQRQRLLQTTRALTVQTVYIYSPEQGPNPESERFFRTPLDLHVIGTLWLTGPERLGPRVPSSTLGENSASACCRRRKQARLLFDRFVVNHVMCGGYFIDYVCFGFQPPETQDHTTKHRYRSCTARVPHLRRRYNTGETPSFHEKRVRPYLGQNCPTLCSKDCARGILGIIGSELLQL